MITLFLSSNFGAWKAPEGSIVFPEAGKAPAEILAFADAMIKKSSTEDVTIVTYAELIPLRIQLRLFEAQFGLCESFSAKFYVVENGEAIKKSLKNLFENLFSEDYYETVNVMKLQSILRGIKTDCLFHKSRKKG